MKYKLKYIFLFSALALLTTAVSAQIKKLSLAEALQEAAKNNRQNQIQLLEWHKTESIIASAKTALLPQVNLQSGYTVFGERPVLYMRDQSANPKVSDMTYGGRFAFTSTIQAQYPINAPDAKSNIRLATIEGKIQSLEWKKTEERVAIEIAKIYITILMYQAQQKVLDQSLVRNQQAMSDARLLFVQGRSLKTDTLHTYLSVQNLKLSLAGMQNTIQDLTAQLVQLLGFNTTTTLILTDSIIPDMILPDTSGNKNDLLSTRFDIRQQGMKMELAKEHIAKVKNYNKPQIWAIASLQVQQQSDDFRLEQFRFPRTSYAGITLSIPIYNGNQKRIKLKQAQTELEQQQITMLELNQTVAREISMLKKQLLLDHQKEMIQQENVTVAQTSYNITQDRYRQGLSSRLELSDAELALTRAKMDLILATYSYQLTNLELLKAMGQLVFSND
ncbi:MAG: TolC family protein [Chitinophagaceae bacterium]|jgi:outer membrane protein TolC|nr:TolC family protein [Chitinophagaceae bacterium]